MQAREAVNVDYRIKTELTIDPVEPIAPHEMPAVKGRLTNEYGMGIAGQQIRCDKDESLNGQRGFLENDSVYTDPDGYFSVSFYWWPEEDLFRTGTYNRVIALSYGGSGTYAKKDAQFISFEVKNPAVSVNAALVWDDGNDQDGCRPDVVRLALIRRDGKEPTYKDGQELGDSVISVIQGKGGNARTDTTFSNLAKYDYSGGQAEEIQYEVIESDPDGLAAWTPPFYRKESSGDMENGFVIKNRHAPKQLDIEITKEWTDNNNAKGFRPDAAAFHLDSGTGDALQKDIRPAAHAEADDWSVSFTGLPYYADGAAVDYSIREDKVIYYTGSDAVEKESALRVRLLWNDGAEKPRSLNAVLVYDGVALGQTVKLNEDNDWTGTFEIGSVTDGSGYSVSFNMLGAYLEQLTLVRRFSVNNTLSTIHTINFDGNGHDEANWTLEVEEGMTIIEMVSALAEAGDEGIWEKLYPFGLEKDGKRYVWTAWCSDKEGKEPFPYGSEQIDEDHTLYAKWQIYTYINEINLKVEPPVCGETTTTQKISKGDAEYWDMESQTNRPKVSIEDENPDYAILEEEGQQYVYWAVSAEDGLEPCIADPFKGGESYPVHVQLIPKKGFLFSPRVKVTVNRNAVPMPEVEDVNEFGYWLAVETLVEALHDWEEDYTVDTQPTCLGEGSKSVHCSQKDAVKDITPIDPLGHDWDRWTVTQEPTTEEEGEEERVCKRDPSHIEKQKIRKLDPDPTPGPTPDPDQDTKCTIIYDLDGGTLDGQTGRVRLEVKKGTVITLPLPAKNGYTFDYWQGSRYEAGEEYTVVSDHTFTARWKKNSSPASPARPINNSSGSRTSSPKTGDTNMPWIWMLILAAGCVTLIIARVRKR